MKRQMKTVVMRDRGTTDALHVETPLGIVNIFSGFSDLKGRNVVAVEIIPSNRIGDHKVKRIGNRLRQCLRATN